MDLLVTEIKWEKKKKKRRNRKKRECQKDKVELPLYNTTKWFQI